MDLIEESASVYGCRLALLEPSLVHLRRDHVWAGLLDLLQDGFLHDLRHMRPDHDGPDLVEAHWAPGCCFLQWHETSHSQVFRDPHVIEGARDLCQDLVVELHILLQHVAVKAVWSKSLVEVRVLGSYGDILDGKG